MQCSRRYVTAHSAALIAEEHHISLYDAAYVAAAGVAGALPSTPVVLDSDCERYIAALRLG